MSTGRRALMNMGVVFIAPQEGTRGDGRCLTKPNPGNRDARDGAFRDLYIQLLSSTNTRMT